MSVRQAAGSLKLEIFVVDNNSSDGSVPYLKRRFPEVIFIENKDNVGFGRANNQAIAQARGKYTLLINPDTLIKEDTLQVLYDHMEAHPETGAAGCKILNPDGTFADESRRTVPTPWSALGKVLGLATLFPKSKRFAGYYMNWMGEDEPSQVPVISGSFMFFRTGILKELAGFDERFFMYGEDIDLCYRLTQSGWVIDYVPATSIIHYKGESTKKDNIDYIIIFNKALYQFFEKHYSNSYPLIFRMVIVMGIVLRGIMVYAKTLVRRLWLPVLDLVVLNTVLIIAFLVRFGIHPANLLTEYKPRYLFVNVCIAILFFVAGKYFDLYGRNRFSAGAALKATFFAFAGTVLITFFWREFAFSRIVLGAAAIGGAFVLVALRLIRKNVARNQPYSAGLFQPTRMLIVGLNEHTADLIRKIRSRVEWNYHIAGVVAQNGGNHDEVEHVPVVGDLSDLGALCRYHKATQVVFLVDAVSHEKVLHAMTQLQHMDLVFKIVPNSLDYIIGKSNVEYLDNIPVVDVQLPYFTPWNRFMKRNLDLALALPAYVLLLPFLGIPWLLSAKDRKAERFYKDEKRWYLLSLYKPESTRKQILNFFGKLGYVIRGKISLVGAPMNPGRNDAMVFYRHGITGLRQYHEARTGLIGEGEPFELYYLQNYSVWMDLDIIVKTLVDRQARSRMFRRSSDL